MQQKLLSFIYRVSVKHGRKVLAVFFLTAVVMGFFIPDLKISSSYQKLISPDHPEQKKYLEFKKEFGSSDSVIIVMEGGCESLKLAADAFAHELKQEKKWINSVFYKSDSKLILQNLPLYIPYQKLLKAEQLLTKNVHYLAMLKRVNNLENLISMTAPFMKSAGGKVDEASLSQGLSVVDAFMTNWEKQVKNGSRQDLCKLDYAPGKEAEDFVKLIKGDGYLFSHDYTMLFMMAKPSSARDDIDYLQPLKKAIQEAEKKTREKNPEIMKGIKVAYTGMPMHILTETETIYSDVGKIGIISIILVALILLVGFRSLKKVLIAVTPLVLGITITLGLFSLTIGTLNIISSSFMAVLFGIGIDFGIYFIRRTEEERGNGATNEEAVRHAVEISGKGILTGGLTTGLAFFAIMLSDFAGYSQLGFTAGIGIFIVLAATFFLMPPLLLAFPISPRSYKVESSEKIARGISSKPGIITITSLLVISLIVSIYAATQLKMDFNVLKLLPQNIESTVFQQKMEDKSDFSMSTATVTASSLKELNERVEKIRKLSSVQRVDALTDLIPDNQKQKMVVINRLKPLFKEVSITYKPVSYTEERVEKLLGTLMELFEMGQEKAFAGGLKKVEKDFESIIGRIEYLQSTLEKDPDKVVKGTAAFEKDIFLLFSGAAKGIQSWAGINPIGLEDVPADLLQRFRSSKGTYVAYINPARSIWEISFLTKFVEDLKNVTSDVTGFPITHRYFIIKAGEAIKRAVIFAIIPVLLILLIDFRNIRALAFSLVPLVIGILWLQAALYFIGATYNVANVIGLPLLFGLGVVYGVHIVHRWLERPDVTAFTAVQTTGRGVAFSALTTISGLLSIVFARHGGVSSFGLVLLLGVFLCLITALFVLPFIIDRLAVKKEKM